MGKKRGVLSFFQSKTSIAPMTNPGSKRFCMNGSAANSWIPFQSGVRGSRIDDSSLTKVSRRTPLRQFFLCTLYNYTELWAGESQGAINAHEYPFDFIADLSQAICALIFSNVVNPCFLPFGYTITLPGLSRCISGRAGEEAPGLSMGQHRWLMKGYPLWVCVTS